MCNIITAEYETLILKSVFHIITYQTIIEPPPAALAFKQYLGITLAHYLYLFFNIQGIVMHSLQTIAISAAGQTIIRAFTELDKIEVTAKVINDYVTKVYEGSGSAITYQIRKSYHDHTIYW